MAKYSHIIFDLDRTLWDFEKNSEETIREIYNLEQLGRTVGSFDLFMQVFKKHNVRQWELYRAGEITKAELRIARFFLTLKDFNYTDITIAQRFDKLYVENSPKKTALFPNTLETLQYLSEKYALYILTNGFTEVQYIKLENSGLAPYFRDVFISEKIGFPKPLPEAFNYILNNLGIDKSDALMIGDDMEVDIIGARNAGIDQVFFNPKKGKSRSIATFDITDLIQLKEIL